MAIHTERVVIYLDDATREAITRLAAGAHVSSGVYVRRLLQRYVAGDPLTSLHIAATLDKVWIAVDALVKTQPWDVALRGTIREIIERRAGRIDA